MDHPLIPKIEGKSLEELQRTISDLRKKLGIARQSGNIFLVTQIQMAISSYQTAYAAELDRLTPKPDSDEDDFGTLIDIS